MTSPPQQQGDTAVLNDEQLTADQLRGLETLCAALHAATESDPVVKDVTWRTFALIRAYREQKADGERLAAELEPFQILTHQACAKKEHADWFIDSEHNHFCPWCRIAELEATPVDWDAQRRRADELEAEVEQLAEAARNALASLDMFIQDHPDPGTQALGDQHLLAQALSKLPVADSGAR